MADRLVTATAKDSDRDITALCNTFQPWMRRAKQDAIDDIESGIHRYYTEDAQRREADVVVVNGENGKHLRTKRDSTCTNNLDNLPDC